MTREMQYAVKARNARRILERERSPILNNFNDEASEGSISGWVGEDLGDKE